MNTGATLYPAAARDRALRPQIVDGDVLPASDPQAGRDAVRKVVERLYDPAGGVIAQFEFGPGANPATVLAILDEWAGVDKETS